MSQPQEILFGAAVPYQMCTITVKDPSQKMRGMDVLMNVLEQLQSTEEGRALYGDPEKGGGTLEQCWRTSFAISGFFSVCLLASGRPPTPTECIPRTVLMTPLQLIDAMAYVFKSESKTSIQIFVYDGNLGHSVSLVSYDPMTSSFLYHEPWPESSFLCSENNVAGVAAEPAEKSYWRISETELSTVIYAAFLFPSDWANLMGLTYKFSYSQLKKSEFWTFFNLHEIDRHKEKNDRTAILLETGGFHDEIILKIELDVSERIVMGFLVLRRSWIVGDPYGVNPFAIDIAKSFIEVMTPELDKEYASPLIDGLWNLRSNLLEGKVEPTSFTEFLLVYLGVHEKTTTLMNYSRMITGNIELNDEKWLEIMLILY